MPAAEALRPPPEALVRRIFAAAVRTESGCWEFRRALTSGYGTVWSRGRRVGAHRIVLAHVLGGLPAGVFACHHCDNPPCVNPDHLFAGSHTDNVRDMYAKGRQGGCAADNAVKTHCPQGHAYTAENTYNDHGPRSGRKCRACNCEDQRRYKARRRAAS